MKILFIILLSLNLYSKEKLDFDTTYGLISTGTILSSFKDSQVTLIEWLKTIATNNNGNVEISFYDDSNILFNDYKNKKLEMIVLEPTYFFKLKKEIDKTSSNFWTSTSNEYKFNQYYLLSNKSAKNKSFKDIKNKSLSIKKDDISADVWLDKSSLIENKLGYKKVLKDIKYENKESTALLDLFFERTDFAIISKKTWEIMIEFNPTLMEKIQIISKSEEIHPVFIGFFSNEAEKKGIDVFFNMGENIKKLSTGEQILNLLKFDYILKIDSETLNSLEKYYNEYFELKNRYEKEE